MRKPVRITAGLFVVALCAVAGVFGTDYVLGLREDAGPSAERGQAPARVGVATPERAAIERTAQGVGTLRPIRAVDLVPDAAGRVTEIAVAPAERVDAARVILRLEDTAQTAALAEAEASVDEARQEFDRVQSLADTNTAAEARLEAALAALRRAEAAEKRARADLADRTLTAPFAGTLGLIDIDPGAYVDGVTVATLSDLSVMEADVSLPERYYDRVAPGQTVRVRTPAYPDTAFTGRVTVRAPEIDQDTRSFGVRAEIDNADRRLASGMFADTSVVLGTREGLLVPDDAVRSEGFDSYVLTVVDGAARRVPVRTGASVEGQTEIMGNVSTDVPVIVSGASALSAGDPVEVAEDIAREGL